MKAILTLATLTFSILSYAAGPLDGIYSCDVSGQGYQEQVYVTVNGQPNGDSIYAIAAVSSYTPIYGYGIGTATATEFSGNTMFGKPFSFKVNPYGGITGWTYMRDDNYYNYYFYVMVSCGKIY